MIELAQERLKRTAPEGSGPATGSADRVAGKEPGEGPECREGGTTDRNRESRAVPPGKARAMEDLESFFMDQASIEAAKRDEATAMGAKTLAALHEGRIEALHLAAMEVRFTVEAARAGQRRS